MVDGVEVLLAGLVNRLYSSKLTATLAVTDQALPFSSMAELVSQDTYTWGIHGGTAVEAILKASEVEVYKQFYKGVLKFAASDPSVRSPLSSVHKEKVFAGRYAVVLGSSELYHAWREENCEIAMTTGVGMKKTGVFYLQKGSPYTSIISSEIERMVAAGLVSHWTERWSQKNAGRCGDGGEKGQIHREIQLVEVLTAFYLAGAGVGLAVLTLGLECLSRRVTCLWALLPSCKCRCALKVYQTAAKFPRQYVIVEAPDNNYGQKLEDGRWNGLIGMLTRKMVAAFGRDFGMLLMVDGVEVLLAGLASKVEVYRKFYEGVLKFAESDPSVLSPKGSVHKAKVFAGNYAVLHDNTTDIRDLMVGYFVFSVSKNGRKVYVIVETPDNNYGQQLEDGRWNGLIGMLTRKTGVFAAVGASFLGALVLLMLCEACRYWWSGQMVAAFGRDFGMLLMVDGVEVLLAGLVNRPTGEFASRAGRVLVCAWLLLGVVLASVYSSKLTATLAVTDQALPFSSMAELVNQDKYTWGLSSSGTATEAILKASKVEVYRKFYEGVLKFAESDPSANTMRRYRSAIGWQQLPRRRHVP
nr:hypothetical protein BaRGS_035121 [Batillaria attramentaria]